MTISAIKTTTHVASRLVLLRVVVGVGQEAVGHQAVREEEIVGHTIPIQARVLERPCGVEALSVPHESLPTMVVHVQLEVAVVVVGARVQVERAEQADPLTGELAGFSELAHRLGQVALAVKERPVEDGGVDADDLVEAIDEIEEPDLEAPLSRYLLMVR